MSISSAMLAGVTGLVSNASSLAAISDNIANSNTVGYKRSAVDFTSLVNTGSHTSYSAGGVVTATRGFVGQQGTLQSSSNVTDLAISGDGFFVTSGRAAGAPRQACSPRPRTRAWARQSGGLNVSSGTGPTMRIRARVWVAAMASSVRPSA